MPEKRQIVIRKRRATARLPDWAGEGVALVMYLYERGWLKQIQERLRIHRSGGYVGIDVVLHLLFYFTCGAGKGLKKFDGQIAGVREQLAALGGRASLPTQSSMSRVLGDVTPEAVRAVGRWLLRDVAEVGELLRHSSMKTLDALGQPWHVFDYDPTKKALRQRALPESGDLPTAQRRADGFAAPGYSGRKRGEVQISRSVLQHAGSALWLDTLLASGNGDPRTQLASALEAVVAVCGEVDHPLNRAVVRLDGEFGNVPSLTALREHAVCGITRLNRPALLDLPEVRRRMADHPWHFVPDSLSGPRRSAMDLGMVTVRPGQKTQRDDGTAYEPIDVRVVVSRYPRKKKAEHGRVIDGWQYELFVGLDLDPEGWPASDIVASYYGRGGQENRFAQEDRELGLDHIFSYTLAGQELACIIGLLVWNLRIIHGFRLNLPPEKRSPALPRVAEVDPRPVPVGFVEEVEVAEVIEDLKPSEGAEPTEPTEPTETADEPDLEDPPATIPKLLSKLDLTKLLKRIPDWQFEADQGVFRCPNQKVVQLTSVSKATHSKSHRLLFEAPIRICRECPQRDKCLPSRNPNQTKKLSLNVPKAAGDAIATRLRMVQLIRRKAHLAQPLASGRPRRAQAGPALVLHPTEGEISTGEWQFQGAQFLPAAARHAFRAACLDIVLRVTVTTRPVDRPHPYQVTTPAQRQHRRKTWAERNACYALSENAKVRVIIEGGTRLAKVLHLGTGPERVLA